MLATSFQEWLRVQWEKDGKPYTRRAFQAWQTQFDQGMSDYVGTIRTYTGKTARRIALNLPPVAR